MKLVEAIAILLVLNSFTAVFLQNVQERVGSKYEILLLNTILKDYDKRCRPVEDFHLPLEVNFSISLHQILQVNEKDQVITSNIWRILFWKDAFLKWNPVTHGNITQVPVKFELNSSDAVSKVSSSTQISILRSHIWAPDIQLYNSASYETQAETNTRVIVKQNGQISEVLPMMVKSTCKIDVTWFPFDKQKCLFTFGSWTHSSQELRLELNENSAYTSGFTSNGEWELLSATAEKCLQFDPYTPTESYVVIIYTMHLKRRTFYYFFNLLVPCGLIGFLAILGFTLPPESGEKLPLGASILFSLIVFLNMISESMPANSDAVPLLGTYFNCVMFTIALSVVSTIVVNLNLSGLNPKEVKGLSEKVFLCWLPWLLRLHTPRHVIEPSSKAKIGDINGSSSDPFCRIRKEQWIFIAAVVDRLCLICSLIFTFISVTVFLVYAF